MLINTTTWNKGSDSKWASYAESGACFSSVSRKRILDLYFDFVSCYSKHINLFTQYGQIRLRHVVIYSIYDTLIVNVLDGNSLVS